MPLQNVGFSFNSKRYDQPFDRSKIKLGKILFVKEIDNGLKVSETEFEESIKTAVNWIAPSDWLS